jgi:glycosyltransferase involved in cell wall biosynthesis
MRIAINAISATGGGGRTYLLNLGRALPQVAPHEYRLYIPASAATALSGLPSNFEITVQAGAERSYLARLFWEQIVLPASARQWGADVLVCVGGFCPLRSPVPVLLLSRNPLYFTPRFLADLMERGHYAWAARHVAMTRLALWSAQAARLTVTPTDAMGAMMRALAGRRGLRLRTIFHGFQLWPGLNGAQPAAPAPPPFRFLVVSHYNYFRNFETVLRAAAKLRASHPAGSVQFVLTTDLRPGLRLGGYDTSRAARLLEELHIRDVVLMLGSVAYDDLPKVYRSAHGVICPAYTESFSHTVVEAMAMGVPVIASDIGVHREVAGEAACFFSPLDPDELVDRCNTLMRDPELRTRMSAAGRKRAKDFDWQRHFQELLAAAEEIA